MAINPEEFMLYNVIDTCAVWNVISSRVMFSRANQAGVRFYCTHFVVYECLYKHRNNPSAVAIGMQDRLRGLMQKGYFEKFNLDIGDLQSVALLQNRKNLGKGELATLAFALKTKQAFLTDDKGARRLGQEVLPAGYTQTTPHLLSWLIFGSLVSDDEKDKILEEHVENGGDIKRHLEEAYRLACVCRCAVPPR